jgi:DNA (cytosine-5)-methyltransferase 1
VRAYYNENDEYAAQWLRNLIDAGHITQGDVDTRSISDVSPDDVRGYDRVHLFAGIGVWDFALNQAGWGSKQVWTGSCPCQPFSIAGKGDGFNDERHLWPEMHRLIQERNPLTVFGEQVASKDGYSWLDLVQADLEGTGYTVGAIVAPAAGFGAPHQRHRMYWVADADDEGSQGREFGRNGTDQRAIGARGLVSGLADTASIRFDGRGSAESVEVQRERTEREGEHTQSEHDGELPGRLKGLRGAGGFWSAAEWIYCRDEKYRPTKSGTFPLAHGATARVGRLRAYGNAICAPQAEEFIKAYLEVRP